MLAVDLRFENRKRAQGREYQIGRHSRQYGFFSESRWLPFFAT